MFDNHRTNEFRIVKKYPNRRLYDTAISSYITLEDVKQLVLEYEKFRVVDAKTNEDITRSILLQIISEEEAQGAPIFTAELLAHIIRFYGDTLQGMMGTYLERSLQCFVDQQHLVREQMRSFIGKTPLTPLTLISEMAERNLSIWQSMNEQLYQQHQREQSEEDPPNKTSETRSSRSSNRK